MKTVWKILSGLGLSGILGGVYNEYDKRHRYKADGYNRLGYDRNGFDRAGFDKKGYNKAGYNIHGFNKDGYDSEGYREDGFSHEGYNRDGFNRSGYNRQGYKENGKDRSGNEKAYYEKKVAEMQENIRNAYLQMSNSQYAYALRDIRVGIEKGIKAILAHEIGKGYENNRLDSNIRVCSQKKVLNQDFINKLYSAKLHCNDALHDDCKKEYNQVYFCYKVLEELTDELKQRTHLPSGY